ncbi:MAG: hypothetical protein C0599_11035 [Salinivirgaceae bacterium]|nr:MAG: hypothetical protein C0599_11035 [Salinivirgaceae bacterium]
MNTLKQPKSIVKLAGITLLFNLLIPTLSYVFIQSKLFVQGDNLLTATNVIYSKGIFNAGIIMELMLVIGLVLLGYSLYLLLRHVNEKLAMFAFVLKCIEALLVGTVTLISFLAYQMISTSEDFQTLAGFLLNQHDILNAIPMFFLGIEMVIFSMLLYKSRLIPRWISVFGIISFASIFIYSLLSITTEGMNLMSLTLPSFLFELICGSWLLIKGIKTNAIIK